MSKRRGISIKQRLEIRRKGPCDICGGVIAPDEGFDISHRIPLALDGADDESNMFPVHRKCHRVETAKKDIPSIAKAKRREARNLGIRKAPTLKGQGFAKAPEQRRASKPMMKPMPDRRPMYE